MTITAHPTLALLVWSGHLGASEEEIFSYHRYIGIVNPVDLPEVMDSAANDVTDLLAESTTGSVPFSNIGQTFPTTVTWDLLKGYIVDEPTGAILTEPEQRVLTDAGLGAASQALPYQDALAITTQMFPHNRTSRNRFYLPPMTSLVMVGNSEVYGTLIDDIQTQLKFANTAHKAESPSWEYGVYSPTAHTMQAIDRYYTGNIMDTIRRRRNKLVETRHALAG